MKFQPKKQGVRRISTMGGKGKASINKKLQYLHSVLKLEVSNIIIVKQYMFYTITGSFEP